MEKQIPIYILKDFVRKISVDGIGASTICSALEELSISREDVQKAIRICLEEGSIDIGNNLKLFTKDHIHDTKNYSGTWFDN